MLRVFSRVDMQSLLNGWSWLFPEGPWSWETCLNRKLLFPLSLGVFLSFSLPTLSPTRTFFLWFHHKIPIWWTFGEPSFSLPYFLYSVYLPQGILLDFQPVNFTVSLAIFKVVTSTTITMHSESMYETRTFSSCHDQPQTFLGVILLLVINLPWLWP